MPRRFLLPLICLLGLALPAAAHAAPEAGMNLSLPFAGNDLQNVKESGAKTVRFFMFTTNTPSQFDGPVADLASIGVKPVFVIVGDAANPPRTPAAVAASAQFGGQAAAPARRRRLRPVRRAGRRPLQGQGRRLGDLERAGCAQVLDGHARADRG